MTAQTYMLHMQDSTHLSEVAQQLSDPLDLTGNRIHSVHLHSTDMEAGRFATQRVSQTAWTYVSCPKYAFAHSVICRDGHAVAESISQLTLPTTQGPPLLKDDMPAKAHLINSSGLSAGSLRLDKLLDLSNADQDLSFSSASDPFDSLPTLLPNDAQTQHHQPTQTQAILADVSGLEPVRGQDLPLQNNSSLLDLDVDAEVIARQDKEDDSSDKLKPDILCAPADNMDQPSSNIAFDKALLSDIHVQGLTELPAKLTDVADLLEPSSHVLHTQSSKASTQRSASDELDALSASDDDFAENVELSSAGINVYSLHQQAPVAPADAGLFIPRLDHQAAQEQMSANSEQQQQQQQHQMTLPHDLASSDHGTVSSALQARVQDNLVQPGLIHQSMPASPSSSSASSIQPLAVSDAEEKITAERQVEPEAILESSQADSDQQQLQLPVSALSYEDQGQLEQDQAAAAVTLLPYEVAMAKAEEAERRLLTGKQILYLVTSCRLLCIAACCHDQMRWTCMPMQSCSCALNYS